MTNEELDVHLLNQSEQMIDQIIAGQYSATALAGSLKLMYSLGIIDAFEYSEEAKADIYRKVSEIFPQIRNRGH